MNLAIQGVAENKFVCVTKKTEREAMLFIRCVQLEKHLRLKSKHPRFLKWVVRQEVRYFNEFIENWVIDHGKNTDEITAHAEPTPIFIELRNLAQKEV